MVTVFECIFEETMRQLAVIFGNRVPEDAVSWSVSNLVLLNDNTVTNVGQLCTEVQYLSPG